jgi:hypothetical protein
MNSKIKIWAATNSSSEKIIAASDTFICRGNPKNAALDLSIHELTGGHIPAAAFFKIDYLILKQVNLQEKKKYIELIFGQDSYEHFKVQDDITRSEIFEYLKSNLPNFSYSLDKYSKFRTVKKPLIGLAVGLGLFIWSYYLGYGIEHGIVYDVTGGHYNSFAGLALAIGSLGTSMVDLIFAPILGLTVFNIIRKLNNPPIVHRLTKKRVA